jgi:hypothetical protein
MSTTGKRAASRPASAAPATLNALIFASAVAGGLWLLVARGQMAWPPGRLLANLYTVAGCVALIGPVVLARRERGDAALGDLIWMTGGVLLWCVDLAEVLRGNVQPLQWPTPLPARTLGLVALALFLGGWRTYGAGRAWSWTNVTGWLLGLFWVGMGLATLGPWGASASAR